MKTKDLNRFLENNIPLKVKTKVISLFLDAHYANDSKTIFMNQKCNLNIIYFSQKGKALKQNQKVFDIINYCFN